MIYMIQEMFCELGMKPLADIIIFSLSYAIGIFTQNTYEEILLKLGNFLRNKVF